MGHRIALPSFFCSHLGELLLQGVAAGADAALCYCIISPTGDEEVKPPSFSLSSFLPSPRTNKMGMKTLKYDGGGVVLLRCVLDDQLDELLGGNINVL